MSLAAARTWREIEPLVRIEIEHQAVGLLDLVDMGAPDVELEHAHLRRGDQPALVLDVEIVVAAGLLPDRIALNSSGKPSEACF